MSSTRHTLERIGSNLEESMGVREHDLKPRLSPVPLAKDIGRKRLNNVGQVAIDQVIPDPEQPRTEFSEEAIERLAASIREKGQLAAIRVRWSDEIGKWIIISGERRWRAAKLAGSSTIDCYFHDGNLTHSEVLEEQLIENLLREDLQPIEEAKSFSRLMQINGWTGKQLADVLHIPASKVTRSLSLLNLPPDIQVQVASGLVPARSAYEISRIDGEELQRELAKRAAEGNLTQPQAASLARQRKGKAKSSPPMTKLTFVAESGIKVTVSVNRKATYPEIEVALEESLAEVRHRMANNVGLF